MLILRQKGLLEKVFLKQKYKFYKKRAIMSISMYQNETTSPTHALHHIHDSPSPKYQQHCEGAKYVSSGESEALKPEQVPVHTH